MTLREWAKSRLDAIEKYPRGWGTAEGVYTAYWNHLEIALFDEEDMGPVCDRVRDVIVRAAAKGRDTGCVPIWCELADTDEDYARLVSILRDARKELLG